MRILRLCLPVALLAAALIFPPAANAQVYISLFAPPLMPSYTMPYATVPNSVWNPGYWAWGPAGYYWVPGTYVTPPQLGLYWTPGYWGVNPYGSGYAWNQGYWGPQVGYYGGINYGVGYYGTGYVGGNWVGNAFSYNTAVTPVNPTYIRNVYVNRTVIVRNVYRYSYNGPGGVRMHPDAQQEAIMRQHHYGLTSLQRTHIQEAAQDRTLLAKVNGGKPPVAVVSHPLSTANRPADFKPVTEADKAAVRDVQHTGAAPSHPNSAPAHAQPPAPTHAKPAQPMHAQPATQPKPPAPMHAQPQSKPPQSAAKPAPAQPQHQAEPKEKPTHPPGAPATSR